MRRFINSFLGRAVSQVIVMALILPFVTLLSISKSVAQVQQTQSWAVLEFVNKGQGGQEVGASAADAVSNELGKLNRYDVIQGETIKRTIEALNLQTPVTDKVSLLRLANELHATTLVTGEIIGWRVVSEGGGKRAEVIMRVVVLDTASGLPVNGSALRTASSVRAGNVDDMTLLNEAFQQGAAAAVADIQSKTLPTATVLNTYETSALINQGARSGFAVGQEIIILRGREQVATAVVQEVEPDSATIKLSRQIKGIQPGDKVRVVFDPPKPKLDWRADGGTTVERTKRGGSNSGFTTVVLVLGIVGLLLSNGRSNSRTAADDVVAEAGIFPEGSDLFGVRIKWRLDLFARGNSQRVEWQVYRNDVPDSPVLVVGGLNTSGVDDSLTGRNVNYGDFGGVIGGSTCNNTANPTTSATVDGVVAGRPYTYSVALVYRLSELDLPGTTTGGTGGLTTGGTTGGLTTGGSGLTTGGTTATTGGTTGLTTGGTTGLTTGGTTATTGGTTATTTGTTTTTGGTGTTTGGNFCYFISARATAKGIATPLARTLLVLPVSNAAVTGDSAFTFQSAVTSFPISIQYALQFSSDPNFPKNKSKVYATIIRSDLGTLSSGVITGLLNKLRSDFGSSTTELWWRVGARNVADKPGPVPDASGERYVFSAARRFTIPSPPPPPPAQ